MLDLHRGWVVVLAMAWGLFELGLPRAAHAGIGACGDIQIEASAQCEIVAPGVTCRAMCKPVSIRAACTAQLAVDCRAECPELPSVDCRGECSGSCTANCDKLEPGHFDCQGACGADCSGRCSASCKAESDRAACEASCNGSCSASCDASCEGQPPEVDCDAGCEASCEGSCEADANFDCQLECQGNGEANCEAVVQGGCEGDCKGEEGALFCDGQYVDHGDHLQECVDALRALLHIEVEGMASGSSGCSEDGGCRAEGRATAKVTSDCAVSRPGAARVRYPALFWGLGLAACLRLRRRTRRM